jgi:hypothetical protein
VKPIKKKTIFKVTELLEEAFIPELLISGMMVVNFEFNKN